MAKKRGAGEGSIYKRQDGRWCGAVVIGRSATGKIRRRVVYGHKRCDVAEKIRDLSNQVASGIVADPGKLRVKDLVSRYLAAKNDGLRARTHELYGSRLNLHVLPYLGGCTLSRLQPVHLLDWLAQLKTAEVGDRTRQDAFDTFRRCLEFGVRTGLLPLNPAERIDRPKANRPEIQSLSAENAAELLKKANETAKPWVAAAVALGLCALRRGEVFGLSWRDVELGSGRLRIRQALSEAADGTRRLGPPKTKEAQREIPLPSWAVAALRRHLNNLPTSPHPTRLVFLSRDGTPIRMSNFYRRHFLPLAERAKLPGITFHQLRHTAATLLLAGGADVKSAQTILGHARASHTLDIYAASVPARVEDAMERLGAAIATAQSV